MNIPITEPEHTRWHKRIEVEAKTAELISAGYTFTFDGKQYTFNTDADALGKLSVAYTVAVAFRASGTPYSQPMVMQDYQIVTMDRDSIISTYEAMIAYGLGLYGQNASILQSLENLTLAELQVFIDPR